MEQKEIIALVLFALVIGTVGGYFANSMLLQETNVEPLFSPDGETEIVSLINSARSSLEIEMYVFSSEAVKKALVDAASRGVKVRVILEGNLQSPKANQETYYYLLANGVEVRWSSTVFSRTHSKFMIIDGKKVLVGSHNFTWSALNTNREASVVFSGPAVNEFEEVFQKDWGMAS